MSEEIKNEEVNIDEKLNELLNDPSIKTEEEKIFVKNVAEKLKAGDVPIDLFMDKRNELKLKFEEVIEKVPEFKQVSELYLKKFDDEMNKMYEMLKNINSGD
jgi:hypothetical protein